MNSLPILWTLFLCYNCVALAVGSTSKYMNFIAINYVMFPRVLEQSLYTQSSV